MFQCFYEMVSFLFKSGYADICRHIRNYSDNGTISKMYLASVLHNRFEIKKKNLNQSLDFQL